MERKDMKNESMLTREKDTNELPQDEQKWINENVTDDIDVVSVTENGSYKQTANCILTKGKLKLANTLRKYNYKTPIFQITELLEELFRECESYPYHWAKIAEFYSPKTINSVLNYMIKNYGDWKTLKNPAAYFTRMIGFRKKRKKFRDTNGNS